MHPLILNGWHKFVGRRVLLLQGPHGPFFRRVARELLAAGASAVTKVNFNGGDVLYYPLSATPYTGSLHDWPAFLAQKIQVGAIDCIIVFGDCRPIHAAAREVAHKLGLQFWVFEEGYVRPNYITLEQHGVNGYSHLPKLRHDYDDWIATDLPPESGLPKSFGLAAKYAMAYFTASTLLWPFFRRYRHHRNLAMLDGLRWVRSLARKISYQSKELDTLNDLPPTGPRKYFLVILQVATDAQVTVHSPFVSVPEFIADTITSFAHFVASTKQDVVLVIKHHPMDRGYCDYARAIDALATQHGLAGRVRYIHDQNLPDLLENASGVVTINSTVGLSAIDHGTPVIALGKSVYNMEGLTCQDTLQQFWRHPENYVPDALLYQKFRNYVTAHTQINGSFYVTTKGARGKRLPWRTSV